ncbi:transposase, partial [Streptomyces mirabilis]|uniref:transposase n=1 Tax=Streptomyces mirabilis TaxID=68239 RepID=UPI0033AEDB5A
PQFRHLFRGEIHIELNEPASLRFHEQDHETLATTVETWWPEILAFLHTGITNAGSEDTNRVIKTIARDAHGFRNPGNQRLRTRCATTRRARGHLDAR